MPYKAQTLNEQQLAKLRSAIEKSEQLINDFRDQRMKALKEYLGAHYCTNGGSDKYNPLNLLELAVNTYMRSLAARQPRVIINTPHVQFKPTASALELALDVLMKRIRLGDSIRMCVMEAFFSPMAVMYVGLNKSQTCEIGGYAHTTGQPFADPVFADEWFIDMSARATELAQFKGHCYLMPRDEYYNCGLFDTSKELSKAEKTGFGFGGTERSETLTTGGMSFHEDYKDFVRLRNVWLPIDGPNGVMITIEDCHDGQSDSGILREVEWDGPERGPYHELKFHEVPGNIMGLPPVAGLIDLHRLANNIMRKLEDGAKNSKTVLAYMSGAHEDAERIISANNLEAIAVTSPDKLKEMQFNGVDPRLLAFLIQSKDLFSWKGGNLDTLGGLSPMSKTVGQDELLSEASSKQIADMQRNVTDFTTDVVRDLAYYLWTDPLIHIPLTKRVANTEIDIPFAFDERIKAGDFIDYNISIDPYSMQHSSPQLKLAALENTVNKFVLPLLQQLTEQGLTIDVRSLLKQVGRYSDMPEIYEIITSSTAPMKPDAGPVGQPPTKSPVTQRSYVREDRSVPTRSGRDNAMMQTLLGGGVQNSEMAAAI